MSAPTVPVAYDGVCDTIRKGMVDLWRPMSLFGQTIVWYTRAVYNHATLFG
jgi:hypothetical protein